MYPSIVFAILLTEDCDTPNLWAIALVAIPSRKLEQIASTLLSLSFRMALKEASYLEEQIDARKREKEAVLRKKTHFKIFQIGAPGSESMR
jgi:hypothetical protein